MDTMKNLFVNVKSKSFDLNRGHTRKLEICLKSLVPSVDFVFKLMAVDHSCHIEFSKDAWNEIVTRSEEIIGTMECQREREIFSNRELKVFTEIRHNKCAVCFVDQQSQRVNMMIATFKKMMSHSWAISSNYKKLLDDLKIIAGQTKAFIDTLVAKYIQCEVENEAYQNHLSDLQNSLEELQAHPALPSLEIDYTDYDSDEEYHDHRRKRYY